MKEMQNEKDLIHDREVKRLNLTIQAQNIRIKELKRRQDLTTRQQDQFDLEDKQLALKGTKAVQYDKEVDVFSEDEQEGPLPNGFNILDIYIGQATYEQGALMSIKAYSDDTGKELQTLITSDFYNFDTESSGICEGVETNYNL